MNQLLSIHTRAINDKVHDLDLDITHGAFASSGSTSAFDLKRAEDTLRRLADEIADRRHRLINQQDGLPFLVAAE